MRSLEKFIINLKKEFDKCSIEGMDTASPIRKLLYLYCYYHYFYADKSKLVDVIQGDVFDCSSVDRIAGIYIDPDADANDVDAIIVDYVQDGEEFDFPMALKSMKDAETMLIKALSDQVSRKPIDTILADKEYKFSSKKPLKIRLITNYSPKNIGKKRSILNALQALKPEKEYITFHISFGYDIENEILEIEDPKEYVDSAIINIDSENNIVLFGEEKSLLVNISAKSLQELYEQYSYRGLFAQNLRYYVKNTKVDESIIDTIRTSPDLFWYLNNGIIIICDDYIIEGKDILLSNFSIINGGQTTKLIGEAEFKTDFYLQCKIIRNKHNDIGEKISFIYKVAEASNTQKPIKGKDLVSNRIEQRLLKRQLLDAGIYCQIKRGERVNRKLYPEPWQNTTNEELGQLLLSFTYQKPGSARSNKASICGNKERYDLIFGKRYNSDFLIDLIKLKAYYKFWISYTKKNDDGSDAFKIGLVNNGMLFTVAIIGAISKLYYHQEYIQSINSSGTSDERIEKISQHDIDHGFLSDELEKEDYFELFELCYLNFFRPAFEFLISFKGGYIVSNFTKVDSNYKTYVFRQVCAVFASGIPEYLKSSFNRYLADVSKDDIERDKVLLFKYVNIISSDFGPTPGLSKEVVSSIKKALIDYRTKIYKLRRIKMYEVFNNTVCDRISNYAPTNMDALQNLKCLDETQLNLYGKDIVVIVNKVLNE
ncbi:MAG: AIPR protein [Firmicutes bacterium ADurb.Bin099]|nr:MAG: AIPR protein [Firmicutes bacterium ADurb.Bin099]